MKKEKLRWNGGMTPFVEVEEANAAREAEIEEDNRLREMLKTALAHTGKGQEYPTRPKGVPIELLITLRKKKLPIKAIARIVKCSPATIRERLKKNKIEDIDFVEEFRKNRADVLAYHQKRVLDSISEEDLNDASLKDKVSSFGTLYDKERVETGKSTGDGKFVVAVINYADYASQTPSPSSVDPVINITPEVRRLNG